ncbi:MAG TPA: LysR family transcriptional regulator [Methylomirabilota bacterium]|nr:LysR family transcriptional regulator [Methylomirabilota bacterium]
MLTKLANVDIKLLRVFATIAEAGGFATAQAQLNLSGSRISTLVADLEARLGMRLCQRGRVGFRLTDQGREIYDASLKLFAALEQFRARAGALSGQLVGDLQLGVVDNTLTNPACRLAQAIGRFKARGADVHVTLQIWAPTELERAVLDGRLAAGIGAFHHHVAGLVYEPLFSEEQTLYCSREHPFFARADASISRQEIAAAEFAERGYMGGVKARRPGADFRATATAYHMEAIATLVLSGRYIGYLPTQYARPWVERGLMRSLLPAELAYESLFEVITRKGAERTLALQAFLDDLRTAHGRPPALRREAGAAPRERRRRRAGSGSGAASRASAASSRRSAAS